MTESKYWSLKPLYSKLALTSNDFYYIYKKKISLIKTLVCQTKNIIILIFFNSTNSPY